VVKKLKEKIDYERVLKEVFQSPQMRAITKLRLAEAITPETAKRPEEFELTNEERSILPLLAENNWIEKTHENKIFLTKSGVDLSAFGLKRLTELEVPLPWDPEPKPEEPCTCGQDDQQDRQPPEEKQVIDPAAFKFTITNNHPGVYEQDYKWIVVVTKAGSNAPDGFADWTDQEYAFINGIGDKAGFFEIAENYYSIEPDDDATAQKIKDALIEAKLQYDPNLQITK
jgi:hypothetical protein